MPKNYDKDKIRRILESEAGIELRRFLIDKSNELRFVDNTPDLPNPIDFSVEVKARKLAFQVIANIMKQIMEWQEKPPKGRTEEDNFYAL